ncbi:TPA: hypothetical protein I7180_05860 [Vibrio vulnificus]|nr:hypothetical protein [Vibrio vulnificus]
MSDIVAEVRKAPKGSLKIYNGHEIGLDDDCILKHLENMQAVSNQIASAIDSGFYIEAISLRIQIADFWLRVFIRNTDENAVVVRKEFGNLLKMSKKLGLPDDIYQELKAFNDTRVKAIHGFLLGKSSLDALEDSARQSKLIISVLIVWVLENCGEVITDIEGRCTRVGDMILFWQRAVEQLMQENMLYE